ncbi:hypothetical protein GCM10025857_66780 [Alicyclobacillus contaminans]|uniref:Peroxiredoxin n=1 Tax=Tetragenococcus osmophilus TaxID=526944 RepID=A0AA37XPA7_9ENTE|nr:hypothetical protein GCM10025857_66780 [Alicyclobacillus contaminans]GMA73324.1 hypothetical protein GCM10025885_23730 [Tetragenococcus osmophilus]
MAIETTKAEVTLESGVRVSCKSRGFEITLDEPKSSGGTNEGMNPVEAMLNSLGACLTIVAKTFARAKKINLKSFKVDLEGELDPDGYMGKNPNAKRGFQKSRRLFTLKLIIQKKRLKISSILLIIPAQFMTRL